MSRAKGEGKVAGLRRFKVYSEYRPTGDEWVTQIPSHWRREKLKHIASIQTSNVDKKSLEGEAPVRLCNYVDVYYNDTIDGEMAFMNANATAEEIRKFTIHNGDVLITKDSESWDDIAVPAHVQTTDADVLCGYHLAQIRPDQGELSGAFLARAFSAFGLRDQFRVAATGVTRYGLSRRWIDNAVFPVPPLEEQERITTFLDRETEKIDALVAKKEELIKLLQEKRTALITHAVTKGLDPNVPMKDSESEFLPDIPAHWDPIRVRYVCRDVADRPHFSPNYLSDGVLSISARNVKVDRWSFGDAKFVSEEDYVEFCKRVVPERGDVLYTKGGTTGIARAVDFDNRFQVWVHIAVLKLRRERIDPFYLAYALNSRAGYLQSQLHTRGATNNDLGLTRLINIVVAMPGIEEQRAIVAELDQESAAIDWLIVRIRKGVSRISELRTALISAAVTGKIDVREEVA